MSSYWQQDARAFAFRRALKQYAESLKIAGPYLAGFIAGSEIHLKATSENRSFLLDQLDDGSYEGELVAIGGEDRFYKESGTVEGIPVMWCWLRDEEEFALLTASTRSES